MPSVDGLSSGLDTTSIINSLISVDAAPQTRLKSSVNAAQQKVTAFQSVNTKLAALQTAADNLKKATGWAPSTATSSSPSVTVTASSTAPAGALNFEVTKLAAGKSVITQDVNGQDLTADVASAMGGSPLDVVKDGKIVGTVTPSSGSLQDMVDAINKASNIGITAVAVRVSEGKYRLQITSTTTGVGKGDFGFISPPTGKAPGTAYNPAANADGPLENLSGGFSDVSVARDAEIKLTGNTSNVTVTSATNTFSNVMPGVTLTVSAQTPGTPVSVSVASDPKAVAASMQSLVDATNAALNELTTQSKSGTVGADGKVTGGGALRGESTLRALRTQILSTVTSALGDGSSPAALGIQSTSTGTLSFDKDKFLTAYAKDPTGVQKLLAPTSADTTAPATGLVERLSTLAKDAVAPFKTSISSQETTIKNMQGRISDWDTRLAQKREAYAKYYSSLESSLSKLKTEGSWLSGQLASLG